MSELPKGWVVTNFADISDYIQRGKGPKYTEFSDYPVVNQKSVRWFGIEEQHLKYVHPEQWEKWDKQRYIKIGDILWNSTGTGTIGRACFVDVQQVKKAKIVDSHVTIVRTNKDVESKFAFYWIMHPEIQGAISGIYNGSTNQVELSKKVVEATKFLLPPLAEQKRIVEKLDQVLAQVDTIKARLDGIPAILKRFRQSVLAAAVSGKLTEEWRTSNQCSDSISCKLDDVVESSFYGPRFSKDDYVDYSNGIPTVRTTDMKNGVIEVTPDTPRVNVADEKIELFRARKGDLLITRTGSIGVMAIFDGDYLAIPSAYLIRFRFKPSVLTKFIYFSLTSPNGQKQMGLSSTAITQPNINAKSIRAIEVNLPSLKEQTEIVRLVEQYFAFADTIEKQVQKAQQRVDKLTQSILAKAFRGELVPQNPSDEPADELLKRIAAARAESEALAKAAKKVGKKSNYQPT